MKKSIFLTIAALGGLGIFHGNAQELDPDAVVTHIAPLQWSVTWEDYTSLNPLNAIVDEGNEEARIFLTGENDEKIFLYYRQEVIFPTYGNYFTINLEGIDLLDGEYILTIPAGYVALLPGTVPNEEQYHYIDVGGGADVEYKATFSGLAGNYFDITWENVTMLSPGNTEGAYMVNTETEEIFELSYLQDDNYNSANLRIVGNSLRVNITNNYPDLTDGTYEFYLPADYVYFNGSENGNAEIEGYEFSYEAPWKEGMVELTYSEEERTLSLTWLDATEVTYNEEYEGDGWGTTGISIYDSEGEQVNVSYPENISFMGNTMTIDLSGLNLAVGECQLSIPEGCLWITVKDITNLTEGIVLRFNYGDNEEDSNGVESIAASNEAYKVYDVNGVLWLETNDKTAIENLPKGIYIINGKKIKR